MAPTQRFKRGWGRVEVGDLQQPDRVEVPRYIPDNFEQAAQAPINKDLDRLSESLGFFNRNLQALGAKWEEDYKKKATEEAVARYQTWLSSTDSNSRIEALRSGTVGWMDDKRTDPVVAKLARRQYGEDIANRLAAQIDNDPEFKASLGKPDFDIEKYIVQKAAPYTQIMAGHVDTATSFRVGLDSIRSAMAKKHVELTGQINTARMESMAMTEIDRTLDAAARQGLTPAQALEGVRGIYKGLGPRMNGGITDLAYGRLDDLLLDSLKRRAEYPDQAAAAVAMLSLDRIDENGTRLGSLSSVLRHKGTVEAIQKKATETLGKAWGEDYRRAVNDSNKGLLQQGGAAFSAIRPRDITNPVTGDRLKLSVEEQKQMAIEDTLNEIRGGRDKPENYPAEYETFVKNGIKHPQWFDAMESAYSGIAAMNLGSKGGISPEQTQAIAEASNRFANLSDSARSYVEVNLSSKAVRFYDAYVAMVRYEKKTPEQAASLLASAYASNIPDKSPQVEMSNRQDLENAVKSLDFSWLPWPFDRSSPKNVGDAYHFIKEMANSMVMRERVDPASAIKHAASIVEQNGMIINGHLVFGIPGITKADEPHFQPMLNNIFEQNAAYYRSIGISSAQDMTVLPSGNNKMLIIGPSGPVMGFSEKDGKPVQSPLYITPDMIKKEREKVTTETNNKTWEAIARWGQSLGPNATKKRSLSPDLIRKQSIVEEPN